jgi:hypothetical protein
MARPCSQILADRGLVEGCARSARVVPPTSSSSHLRPFAMAIRRALRAQHASAAATTGASMAAESPAKMKMPIALNLEESSHAHL